ncbi:MAG TPA: capsule assembly Wzi family protein [Mucilaginibacter sp.]|nr:capsule assembly Wzi family protein [Mucilaginibacter sp.]
MRKVFFKLSIALIFASFFKLSVHAQSVAVGTPAVDDYYRRMQLLGQIDSSVSFTIRPINPDKLQNKIYDVYDPDSSLSRDNWVHTGPYSFANGAGKFQILPFTWIQQYNSDHPYGWNDGPMIPAKGYQTMISGGFYFKYGPLSIQLRPEFVYAANPSFAGFATGHGDADIAKYYDFYNKIDLPERYGSGSYSKSFLGQSSINLTFGPANIGLSNENIWWGPGIRNSLILSNNAPGFKHLTVNTIRPVNTFLGAFEGQIIAGRLDASGFTPLEVTKLSNGSNLVKKKRTDWRYYTGININYHPKWIPGLTLGLIRTFNAYSSDVNTISEYIPFFFPYQKQNTANNNGDPIPRDQETSLYARWLFKKAHAEVYFEYGLNDNSYNFRDFIGSPEHSRAYVFGLRKMIDLNKKDQHILFSGEIIQLSQTVDRIVREAGYAWYVHSDVTQGVTNLGQVLGSGTGPGGNFQSLGVSWVSGLKDFGVTFERYEHNVDFSDAYLSDINGNSRKWVDYSIGVKGNWNYKNLIFSATIEDIKSLNYEWVLKDYDPSVYYIPHNTVYNLHAVLGLTFRF